MGTLKSWAPCRDQWRISNQSSISMYFAERSSCTANIENQDMLKNLKVIKLNQINAINTYINTIHPVHVHPLSQFQTFPCLSQPSKFPQRCVYEPNLDSRSSAHFFPHERPLATLRTSIDTSQGTG